MFHNHDIVQNFRDMKSKAMNQKSKNTGAHSHRESMERGLHRNMPPTVPMKRGIVAASITLCPSNKKDDTDFKHSIENIEVKY